MKNILKWALLIFTISSLTLLIRNQSYYFYKKITKPHISDFNTKKIDNNKQTIKVRMLNAPFKWMTIGTLHKILEEHYNIKYVEDDTYDLVIDQSFGNEKINNNNAVKFFYTGEPEAPRIKGYDLSIGFANIDHPNYIRVSYAYMDSWFLKFLDIDINYKREQAQGKCNPNKKYFACFMVSNPRNGEGAIMRTKLFHQLSLYKEVKSGGKHLNNTEGVISQKDTMVFLSNCKFIISYENTMQDGYITEKPYQSYFAGAVPIYYAHPNTMKDINKDALIFTPSFNSEQDIVDYVKNIDQNDEKYCQIWNNNIINKNEMSRKEIYNRLRKKVYKVLDDRLKLNKL